jgi:hypothetical protein
MGLVLLVPTVASADSSLSQSVTEGYGSSQNLQKGTIVMLDSKDPTQVDALTQASIADMQGVVVAANDAPVTLSSSGNTNQVYVATFGRYGVLVSNQNGSIKSGDYITISSLAGVGMKANTTQAIILGKADASFDGISNVEGGATLNESGGKHVAVSIGRIQVDIVISHNPLQASATANLPGFLSKAGQLVANKPVSAGRVYISIFILLISAVLAGSMLYSGVRSGLTAIGRNPLAKKSITRNLIQVIFTSLGIFIIGLFGVYLLLKL